MLTTAPGLTLSPVASSGRPTSSSNAPVLKRSEVDNSWSQRTNSRLMLGIACVHGVRRECAAVLVSSLCQQLAPLKHRPGPEDWGVPELYASKLYFPLILVCVLLTHYTISPLNPRWRCDGELLGQSQTDGPHSWDSILVTETIWLATHTPIPPHRRRHTPQNVSQEKAPTKA